MERMGKLAERSGVISCVQWRPAWAATPPMLSVRVKAAAVYATLDAQFARCTAFHAHPSRLGCQQHVTPCRYLYVGRAPTLGQANRMKHAALLAVYGSQVSPQLLTMDVSDITGKQRPASCVQGARYVGWPLGRRHTLCRFKGGSSASADAHVGWHSCLQFWACDGSLHHVLSKQCGLHHMTTIVCAQPLR